MSDKFEEAIRAAFDDGKKEEAAAAPAEQPAAAEEQPQPVAELPGATQSRPAGGGRPGGPAGGRPVLGMGVVGKMKGAGLLSATSASRAVPGAAAPAAAQPAATQTRSAVVSGAASPVRPLSSSVAVVASGSSARGGSAMLLLVLLVVNVITLVLCAGALAKLSGLSSRVMTLETKLDAVGKSADWASKLHGGVTYMGGDKRPQKYIVTIVDNAGKPEFGPVVMRPLEE